MPYTIVRKNGGFFVSDPSGHLYSNHPLSFGKARKQEIAIIINEKRNMSRNILSRYK
jgi:hypothetical protein